jgi:hypothetical protein
VDVTCTGNFECLKRADVVYQWAGTTTQTGRNFPSERLFAAATALPRRLSRVPVTLELGAKTVADQFL